MKYLHFITFDLNKKCGVLWGAKIAYVHRRGIGIDGFPYRPKYTVTLNSNLVSVTTEIFLKVKQWFEPKVLRRKGDGILLILKASSQDTYLWVKLGGSNIMIMVQSTSIERGSENRLSRNEMLCVVYNHNYMNKKINK